MRGRSGKNGLLVALFGNILQRTLEGIYTIEYTIYESVKKTMHQ